MSKETVINPEKIMGCVSILKQLLDQHKTQDIIDLVNKIYLQPKLIDPRFEFTSKTNIIILFTAEANLIGKYLEEGNRSKIKKLIELFVIRIIRKNKINKNDVSLFMHKYNNYCCNINGSNV